MPLDSNKIAHIQSLYSSSKIWAQRQKTVVLVILASGVYSYSTLLCVFRPLDVVDPEIPDISDAAPKQKYDMLMQAPISTNFTGVQYVADTTTATSGAVASAAKYQIIEAIPVGIIPGGTRINCYLRRWRG